VGAVEGQPGRRTVAECTHSMPVAVAAGTAADIAAAPAAPMHEICSLAVEQSLRRHVAVLIAVYCWAAAAMEASLQRSAIA
jgi:hypothetical protein